MRRRLLPAFALAAALLGPGSAFPRQASAPAPSAAPGEVTPPPAITTPESTPAPTPGPDCLARSLDASERDTLLRLAWRTLSGHLTDNPIKDADLEAYEFTPCLRAPRGLFVTLNKGEQVRGRQGEMEPTRPLYQQVIVFTRRAATRDPRFVPLSAQDLGGLTIELSIIGGRRKVGGPSDIHLDTEGVFLEKWGRRAVFLPGIAARQGWSPERTLDELCAQAALPKKSWSESARLEVFTTEEVAGGAPPSPTPSPDPPPAPAARRLGRDAVEGPVRIFRSVSSGVCRKRGARWTI